MYDLQSGELVVVGRDSADEEQRSVSPVYDFCIFVFQEITHLGSTGEHQLRYVFHDLGLDFLRHRREPFLQPDLAWVGRD